MSEKKLKVTMLKSKFGRKPGNRECLLGMGLKRRHQSVELVDNVYTRGMIAKVSYLVKVEEI